MQKIIKNQIVTDNLVKKNQELKLTSELLALSPILSEFWAVDDKSKGNTKWFSLCTQSQPARVFFKGTWEGHIFRLNVSKFAAMAYQTLLDDKHVPIIKPNLILQVNKKAIDLRTALSCIPLSVLPESANTIDFAKGIETLEGWKPSSLVSGSAKGDINRRWMMFALAREFAKHFENIPNEFIAALVQIGWSELHPRLVYSTLTSEVRLFIKSEVKLEQQNKIIEEIAGVETDQILQRLKPQAKPLNPEAKFLLEKFESIVDRLKQGKKPFVSDTALIHHYLDLIPYFYDVAFAEDLTQAIKNTADEYDQHY